MAVNHWSDDELIGRLYGLGPADRHLEECQACRERWQQLCAVRERVVRAPQVSEQFLAGQRQAIYDRLERVGVSSWRLSFAPALGMLAVIVVALLLSRPAPGPQPSLASSDAQFFTDVYSVVQSTEPYAVAPIHGLFEVEQ